MNNKERIRKDTTPEAGFAGGVPTNGDHKAYVRPRLRLYGSLADYTHASMNEGSDGVTDPVPLGSGPGST